MKKTTMIVTIVLLVVVVGVVGVYAYLTDKAKTDNQEATWSAVEKVLNRDLSTDYPATPKEVIKYYTEIEKCFYADSTTDEELKALGLKARELYDADLLEINEQEEYLINLKEDVQAFKDRKRTITGVNVSPSVNVDIFQEDGYDFARLNCGYILLDNGTTKNVVVVYLLRKDENRLWKIYGWDNAENVHIQQLDAIK